MGYTTLFDHWGTPRPCPAKVLGDFLEFAVNRQWVNDKGWACTECAGLGWNYDPDEQPDPVEGYKLCRRLKCKSCNHTGINENDRGYYEKLYDSIVRQNQLDIDKWHEYTCRYQELLNRLGLSNILEIKELTGFELKPLA